MEERFYKTGKRKKEGGGFHIQNFCPTSRVNLNRHINNGCTERI